MLYNIHDSKFSKIFKSLIFWFSLGAMLCLCAFLLRNEIKIPQNKTVINVDINNKVNICKPEEENVAAK